MTLNQEATFIVFAVIVGGALLLGRSRQERPAEQQGRIARPRVVHKWQTRQFWRWMAWWWTLPR